VTTHAVRLKLFRLKAPEKHNCGTLAEKHLPAIANSGEAGEANFCIKHGFKVRSIPTFPNSLLTSAYLPDF